MRVIQVSQRTPKLPDNIEGLADHIVEGLKRRFYEELDAHLAETPGGVILGPTRLSQRTETDWLFSSGETVVFNVSATCEDLPEPPQFRLIGGPADGAIVRTRGEKTWLVPFYPRPPSVASYAEDLTPVNHMVAEYERQGDTSAYFYRRSYEQ